MNAKPFLVLGLPRSRTAWLSVMLTTDTTFCYHEPTEHMTDLSDIEAFFKSEAYKFKGVADSTLGFFAEEILKKYAMRTVVVDRDIREVEASLARIGLPPTNYCELLREQLLKVRNHPLVMWVPFEALKQKRVIRALYWHLMPGMVFDETRYDLMEKMHVETDIARAVEAAHKGKDRFAMLMSRFMPMLRPKVPMRAGVH